MRADRLERKLIAVVCGFFLSVSPSVRAQPTAKDLVNTMLAHERDAAVHKDNFIYLSNERSDRTGGHMWTERVAETPHGRVRLLLSEDGKPIPAERVQAEHERLANDAAHPEAFEQREKMQKDEEARARQTMEMLGKAFILENLKEQNGNWRIDFRPDPNFSPSGLEERVLYAMSGWLLIEQRQMRLHHLEGRLPQDLSIGYGLLKVHQGSNFETTKAPYDGQWRTVRVISDIRGKAALFKTISKNQDVSRSEFKHVGNTLTVAEAVDLLER